MTDPLTIIALFVGLFLVIVVILVYGMYRTASKGRGDFARAIPASARITRVGESYNSANYGTVVVKLTVEVTPPQGAPFEQTQSWAIQPASVSQLQAGRTIAIRIDTRNPQKIYSAEDWAETMNA